MRKAGLVVREPLESLFGENDEQRYEVGRQSRSFTARVSMVVLYYDLDRVDRARRPSVESGAQVPEIPQELSEFHDRN